MITRNSYGISCGISKSLYSCSKKLLYPTTTPIGPEKHILTKNVLLPNYLPAIMKNSLWESLDILPAKMMSYFCIIPYKSTIAFITEWLSE